MRAFKGFNKDLTCRGYQYEEGKEFHTERAECCDTGFHACEYPLDCFGYYDPAYSVFHEVELSGEMDKSGDNTKVCATDIKIGARLSIAGLVKMATYSEWCSFNSYVGWLQHCDSFRLYQKYVEPNVEYMHNYYLKEVKGNAEICKRKNYSGERKAS